MGAIRRFGPACAARPEVPCFLCGGALDHGADLHLRGFAICTACAGELSMGDPGDEVGAPAPMRTPGAGTVLCAGCGRSMPGPGSYRLVGGAPHCPACAPPGADIARLRLPPTVDREAVCAACQRATPRAELRTARGFRLCAACLDSDPALALALARARHRRALQDLGRRLLGDADRDDE